MTISSKILNKNKQNREIKNKLIKNFTYWQGLLEIETYNRNKIFTKTNIPNENTNLDLFSTMQTINNHINVETKSINYKTNINNKDILHYFDVKKFALVIASNLVWGSTLFIQN